MIETRIVCKPDRELVKFDEQHYNVELGDAWVRVVNKYNGSLHAAFPAHAVVAISFGIEA